MQAVIRSKYGNPDVIRIADISIPRPKANEVLIKVYATTVNRTDEGVIKGKPFIFRFFVGFPKPRHQVLGTDFAGVVEAIGEQVQNFKVGDRVFGFNDNSAPSQAEYMTFPADGPIDTIPNNISFATAAASLEGAHYALNFMNKTPLQAGQKVLLNGATGGIGSAMLQMLKAKGLYVTAVCNTKNIALIKSLGADKIYDYLTEDFTKDEEIYDYVLDAVGKSRFKICKPLLKPNGAYISSELGPNAENIFLALFTPLFSKKKVLFPLPTDIKGSIKQIKQLLALGKFKPVIEREYPLAEVKAAYQHMLTGEKTGNLILRIREE